MKKNLKNKIIGVILFVLIIFLFLGIVVYAVGNGNGEFEVTQVFDRLSGKDKNEEEKQIEKIVQEIAYMGSGIIDISNEMNNLKMNEISVKSEVVKENESGKQDSQKTTTEENKDGESETSSQENLQETTESENTKMEVKPNLLNIEDEVKWEEVESKIQTITQAWPVIVIDLKEKGINNEIILVASERKDDLMQSIYIKDKEKVIENCYLIYEQYIKIYESINKEQLAKKEKIKYELLKMYYAIEKNDLYELKKSIKEANGSITELLTKVDNTSFNQISVKKTYVMINNLSIFVNKLKEENAKDELKNNKKFLLTKYNEIMTETMNM